MPHTNLHRLSGLDHVKKVKGSDFEFDPHVAATGLTKEQMHQFLLEEKREGTHPSLKNYR